MLSYLDTQNALHVRTIDFTPQEYMFTLQVALGERPEVAYANVFYPADFRRNVPSEDEEEFLAQFKKQAATLLEQQTCVQLRDSLEQDYQSDVQDKASTLQDFKFTGADAQKILNNLLHDRTQQLSESSVKDIISLLKMMYENGSLDSGDSFSHHFITVPKKYDTVCPNCGREGYATEGLDFRCQHCDCVAKWSEADKRYYPELESL